MGANSAPKPMRKPLPWEINHWMEAAPISVLEAEFHRITNLSVFKAASCDRRMYIQELLPDSETQYEHKVAYYLEALAHGIAQRLLMDDSERATEAEAESLAMFIGLKPDNLGSDLPIVYGDEERKELKEAFDQRTYNMLIVGYALANGTSLEAASSAIGRLQDSLYPSPDDTE